MKTISWKTVDEIPRSQTNSRISGGYPRCSQLALNEPKFDECCMKLKNMAASCSYLGGQVELITVSVMGKLAKNSSTAGDSDSFPSRTSRISCNAEGRFGWFLKLAGKASGLKLSKQ